MCQIRFGRSGMFLHTAGAGVESADEAKAAVVLREGLGLLPARVAYRQLRRNFSGGEEKDGERGEVDSYQFAATMGLDLRFNFLDFGFCFTFGLEERFFFFWSSRPIFGERTIYGRPKYHLFGRIRRRRVQRCRISFLSDN